VIWAIVFFMLGAVNLYVMYTFSNTVWVWYKLAAIGLTFVTLIVQFAWIYKRAPEAFIDPDEKRESVDPNREPPGSGR
jgi:intracellular septation protein A